ncbi:MAG: SocA family protein [Rhizobiales bacterium]|nr:SocA family protein [Hyphomicrobiales bacterium]
MSFDKEKLKAVILHVCAKCDPSNLGAIKLHKVLYFSDMLRYANVGDSITGSTYRKRPLGPTCEQLLGTLSELQRVGALEITRVNYFGYLKKQFSAKVKPDTNRLSADELALLDEVIEFVCDANSAKTISEFSHNRAWDMVEFGDIIEYKSVFQIFPIEVSEKSKEWAASEVKQLEDKTSGGKAPLGGKLLGEFREFILQARGKARTVLGTARLH